ncbi:HAD-like domain-containing protein [Ganoderma leucocontextum]|nr:HAD-like domain-containing protein [Ganoderma leucocontextum]
MFLKLGYTDFVFDVSDVLITWPPDLTCPIDRKVLRSYLVTRTWFQYESGKISKEECLQRLATKFSHEPVNIDNAWRHVTAALRPNEEMVALIKEIRETTGGKARIFGTFNVSRPDYEFFRSRVDVDWSIFDAVFASHELDIRLPNPGFFKRVLAKEEWKIEPHDTVFVGHDSDDVVTARSFGMHGVLLADFKEARRELRNIVGDPVKRGWEYLRANAGKLACDADRPGVSIMENFGQLLILEATGDRSLVQLTEPPRYWNYFQGKGILTHEKFPDDLDTTSLGLVTLKPSKEHCNSLMDEMLTLLTEDGLPYTYFDRDMPRLDPVVAVNVLHLFYTHGRGHELPGALEFVHSLLQNRAYIDGTRYYFRECVLYFIARLLEASDDRHLHETLEDLLRERVQELIGAPGDAIALAFRVATCASVGVRNEIDMRNLLPMQCEDGGWEIGYIYRYGISGMKVGSRGYTTAMAIKAIEELDKLRAKQGVQGR